MGILCTKYQRKYISLFAFLFCGFSLFFYGPSPTLGLPPSLAITLVGEGLLGFAISFIFVPILPEIIAAVSEKHGLENTPFLSDKASGIYNGAYGIGNCLAPLLGGIIAGAKIDAEGGDKTVGFPFVCDVMAFSSIGYAIIFFFVAILPDLVRGKKEAAEKGKREQNLIDSTLAEDGNRGENHLTLEFERNRASQIMAEQ